jgi:hypothetical protein
MCKVICYGRGVFIDKYPDISPPSLPWRKMADVIWGGVSWQKENVIFSGGDVYHLMFLYKNFGHCYNVSTQRHQRPEWKGWTYGVYTHA